MDPVERGLSYRWKRSPPLRETLRGDSLLSLLHCAARVLEREGVFTDTDLEWVDRLYCTEEHKS